MNREDFMNQLERLLQSIAPGERDEALQYYNDYFDDAGRENEREVIEALGNPARVAENIKKDLLGSGYGGGPVAKAEASDRALIEYGKEESSDTVFGQGGFGETSSDGWEKASDAGPQKDIYYGQENEEAPSGKAGMPPWAIALLVTLLIFSSPVILGLAATLLGIIVCWCALVLCAGVAAAALLVVLVVLVVTGILCCFVNPWVGMALVGGGLICGGIGLLFLMLTVAMAGVITPAFWRGVRRLFKRRGRA